MPKPTKGARMGGSAAHEKLLLANLAKALFEHGRITTTEAKARRLRPYAERLITKAKKGDLHNRRQVIAGLQTVASAHKLVDDIAPKLKGRTSGHLRIEKTTLRVGDNAQLARVSFVDSLAEAPVAKPASKETMPKEPISAKEKK